MFDDPRVVSAIISVISAIISILASTLLSLHTTRNDIKKTKMATRNEYAANLNSKRIETYPVLYSLISKFAKITEYNTISPYRETVSLETICILYKNVSDWDNDNAIFMSSKTRHVMWELRSCLSEIISKPDRVDDSVVSVIIPKISKLEISLMVDIGVLAVENYDQLEFFSSDKEINLSWRRDRDKIIRQQY